VALVVLYMACQPRINERECGEGKLDAATGSGEGSLVEAKAAIDRKCELEYKDKIRCTFRKEDKLTDHGVMSAHFHAPAR
jgi:hypothetical protein